MQRAASCRWHVSEAKAGLADAQRLTEGIKIYNYILFSARS